MSLRRHMGAAILYCFLAVSCASNNTTVEPEGPTSEAPQDPRFAATQGGTVLGFNGLGPPVEGRVRGVLTTGGQGNLTNNQYSPGLFQRLDVGYGSADSIDTRLSFQLNLDTEEDNVDTTRHATWFAGELRAVGPLHRTGDSRRGEEQLILWSAGISGEENTPFTEKSLLLHVGMAYRWSKGSTAMTTTVGAGHYSWEADDEVPRGSFSRDRGELGFRDTGLFAGIEFSHRFDSGIRLSSNTIALIHHGTVLRELRTAANIEFPLPEFLGRPETLASKRLVVSGEYRTFELVDGILPFDEEARFQIALQTSF